MQGAEKVKLYENQGGLKVIHISSSFQVLVITHSHM